jgi:hypothetical protein
MLAVIFIDNSCFLHTKKSSPMIATTPGVYLVICTQPNQKEDYQTILEHDHE